MYAKMLEFAIQLLEFCCTLEVLSIVALQVVAGSFLVADNDVDKNRPVSKVIKCIPQGPFFEICVSFLYQF